MAEKYRVHIWVPASPEEKSWPPDLVEAQAKLQSEIDTITSLEDDTSCRLCGDRGPLTDEHAPAKKAGNPSRLTVREIEPNKSVAAGQGVWTSRTIQGAKVKRLCKRCNTSTGRWYNPAYIRLAQHCENLARQENAGEVCDVDVEVHPQRVLKQALTLDRGDVPAWSDCPVSPTSGIPHRSGSSRADCANSVCGFTSWQIEAAAPLDFPAGCRLIGKRGRFGGLVSFVQSSRFGHWVGSQRLGIGRSKGHSMLPDGAKYPSTTNGGLSSRPLASGLSANFWPISDRRVCSPNKLYRRGPDPVAILAVFATTLLPNRPEPGHTSSTISYP